MEDLKKETALIIPLCEQHVLVASTSVEASDLACEREGLEVIEDITEQVRGNGSQTGRRSFGLSGAFDSTNPKASNYKPEGMWGGKGRKIPEC